MLLSILITACTSNTILEKPKNLIPKEQMVDLLTDMLLANGADNFKNINLQRNVNYFPLVFEKHQIDTTRFKESSYYYTSKIDEYDDIFEQVDQRLKALKEQYDIEIKLTDSIDRAKKDSLRNLKNVRAREIQKKGDTLKDFLKKTT